jgi:type IV secretory pathway VirB10-like protein
MKMTRFLITIGALGAFTFGPGFAGASSTVPPGNRAKTTSIPSLHVKHGQEGPASAKNSQSSAAKTTAKAHSGPKLPQPFHANAGHPAQKRTNNAQTKGALGNLGELHQAGLKKAAAGTKAGPMMSEMERQRRLAMAGLPGAPRPNQVAHSWAPGQAFIGGPAVWSAKNTAVIGGTGMKHKP